MEQKTHDTMLAETSELENLLAACRTEDILSTLAVELRNHVFPGNEKRKRLISPAKQVMYAIGLLQKRPEPAEAIRIESTELERIISLLNSIFGAYAKSYFPKDGEEVNDAWRQVREVAMPTFIHYFNTAIMASVEQIVDRIERELLPFEAFVRGRFGFTPRRAIEIAAEIGAIQQKRLDRCYQFHQRMDELRVSLLKRAKAEGWSKQKFLAESESAGAPEAARELFEAIDGLYVFQKSDFSKDESLEEFLQCFSLSRGEGIDFVYLTERNPAELRPLFKLADDLYHCPSANNLFAGILLSLELAVADGAVKDSYLRLRDRLLEERAESLFLALCDPGARAYRGLFETRDANYEHDLVLCSGRNLYIVEAKASPPQEPFRDPDKAYTRLKRHFASDRGIQKAYEQAERLRERIVREHVVLLFDVEGVEILRLDKADYDNIFCVCLTRQDYGPLATNLNLLLERSADSPYPWVVCEFDLESLMQGFKHFRLTEKSFVDYLKKRIPLHGRVFGTDELEFAGAYLKGGLKDIAVKPRTLTFLHPDLSDIFDDIYLAERQGDQLSLNEWRLSGGVSSAFAAKPQVADRKRVHARAREKAARIARKRQRRRR